MLPIYTVSLFNRVIITGPPMGVKWQNVGKREPIFVIFFTVKFRRNLRKKPELKLTITSTTQICCHTTL